MVAKKLRVNGDTQIHMTSVYRRKKNKKEKIKRKFNLVIKGIFLSTALIGSVLIGGVENIVEASSSNTVPIENVTGVHQQVKQDQVSVAMNLKMASKVLESAIGSGDLTLDMYESIIKKLISFEAFLVATEKINDYTPFLSALDYTDKVLKSDPKKYNEDLLDKRTQSLETLERVQDKLGISPDERRYDELALKDWVKQEVVKHELTSKTKEIDKAFSKAKEGLNQFKNNEIVTPVKDQTVGIASLKDKSTVTTPVKTTTVGDVKSQQTFKTASVSEVKASNTTITNFLDYVDGQWWSQDILWAVNKGIIKGYIDQTHPTDKSIKHKGNWLNPAGTVTEAEMLTMVFRTTKPSEINSKQSHGYWASPAYDLASSYGLNVKGSVSNRKVADSPTSRGTLADVIATLHFGKSVTGDQAIYFMYDSGLTKGKSSTGGQTIENYDKNGKLTRAEIASFMKRYTDFINSGKKVELRGGKDKVNDFDLTKWEIAPPNPKKVGNVVAYYGDHTYATANQYEYETVMKIVYDTLKEYYNRGFDQDTDKYLMEYLDGARDIIYDRSNPNYRTTRNIVLTNADMYLSDLVKNNVDRDIIEKVLVVSRAVGALYSDDEVDPRNSSPRSAYDKLVRKINDCDSQAQTVAAVFDSAGFTTAILRSSVHADAFIKIDGKWYDARSLKEVDNSIKNSMRSGYTKVMVKPTDGSKFEY